MGDRAGFLVFGACRRSAIRARILQPLELVILSHAFFEILRIFCIFWIFFIYFIYLLIYFCRVIYFFGVLRLFFIGE